MGGRGILLFVMVSAFAAPAAAATDHALHLTVRWGAEPPVEHILTPVRAGDGAHVYRWDARADGCCGGELTVERGGVVRLDVRVRNDARTARDLRLGLRTALPRGLHAPTELAGTLTGSFAGRADVAPLDGRPLFALALNGTPVAAVPFPPPGPAARGRTAFAPQSYGGRYGPGAGDDTGRELAIRLGLHLGAGARARFHTRMEVTTAPFPVGVLALGGALLVILVLVRRRRIGLAAARSAAPPAP